MAEGDAAARARERWENPDPANAQTGAQLVRQISPKELAIFGSQQTRSCAGCKFFNHRAAQEKLFKDKELATIIHDYEWKVQHLCTDPKDLGVCEQRGLFTGPTYAPCEDYVAKR